MIGEFGQPETIYDGEASLIMAVAAYPARFSEQTHTLVTELIAQQITVNPEH